MSEESKTVVECLDIHLRSSHQVPDQPQFWNLSGSLAPQRLECVQREDFCFEMIVNSMNLVSFVNYNQETVQQQHLDELTVFRKVALRSQ